MLQKRLVGRQGAFLMCNQTKQTVSWHSKHKALRPETDVAPDINQVIISQRLFSRKIPVGTLNEHKLAGSDNSVTECDIVAAGIVLK